jgi:amino acid adenylation domain-containing protein
MNTAHMPFKQLCVPQLVAAQATATPSAVALVAGGVEVTYRELDSMASRLAHYLRSRGAGRELLIALCLERSITMVVAALGVLKSGAAYLPLDPSYPRERLALLLNDSQAPILVTQQRLVKEKLGDDCYVVDLDADADQIEHCPEYAGETGLELENLAYVIYTSGSTGPPKGVQITHGSLLNLVEWHRCTFGVNASDRATLQASPGFDASVWELWPYLTAGASVHLPDDDIRSNPESLRDWLVSKRITITFIPTPMAERIIGLGWPPETSLRTLLTGADTLHIYPSPTLPFSLVNNYGPTECTVVSCSGYVRPHARPHTLPPIGRPIANTQIYILNEQLQKVPAGEVGEIYIGGVGLARGYRNGAELTAAKFIPDIFSSVPNARLYKTGDLGRLLPDGQIAFVGRIDEQVKIRGYRVEPNEIVSALSQHPMVQGSLVVAREVSPGDKRLLAYVVPKPGVEPRDKDLREYLRRQFPEFMMPATFVRIDSMPLNSSGKINRNALPLPTEANTLRDEPYVPTRSPIEHRLAVIVAELLDLERIGLNDNFFLLGGNSLLGAQVIAQVRDAFSVELSLLTLFDRPTVSELSAEIERLLVAKLSTMSEDDAQRLIGTPRTAVSL